MNCEDSKWILKINTGTNQGATHSTRELHIQNTSKGKQTIAFHAYYLSSVQYNTYRVVFIFIYVLVDVRNQMFLS